MNKKRTIIILAIAVAVILIIWNWDKIKAMFNGNGSTQRNVSPCQKGKIYTIGGNDYECCGQQNGQNVYYPLSTGGCSGPAINTVRGGVYPLKSGNA